MPRFREGDKVRYAKDAFAKFGVSFQTSRAASQVYEVERVWRTTAGYVYCDLIMTLPSGRKSSGLSVREDILERVHE